MKIKREDFNFDKLPKKVQEYIITIERERESAIKALNEYLDNQTKSPFSYNDFLCTGEEETGGPTYKTKYVQTHKMEIEHCGVILSVMLRDKTIDMKWESSNHGLREVAFIPSCFQGARLVSKDNMSK
jgi:hypothetical protein